MKGCPSPRQGSSSCATLAISLIPHEQVRRKPIWRCCSWKSFRCGLKPLSASEAIQICVVADLYNLEKDRLECFHFRFRYQLKAARRSSERSEYFKNEGLKETERLYSQLSRSILAGKNKRSYWSLALCPDPWANRAVLAENDGKMITYDLLWSKAAQQSLRTLW